MIYLLWRGGELRQVLENCTRNEERTQLRIACFRSVPPPKMNEKQREKRAALITFSIGHFTSIQHGRTNSPDLLISEPMEANFAAYFFFPLLAPHHAGSEGGTRNTLNRNNSEVPVAAKTKVRFFSTSPIRSHMSQAQELVFNYGSHHDDDGETKSIFLSLPHTRTHILTPSKPNTK